MRGAASTKSTVTTLSIRVDAVDFVDWLDARRGTSIAETTGLFSASSKSMRVPSTADVCRVSSTRFGGSFV